MRRLNRLAAAAAVTALALSSAACGSDDDKDASSSASDAAADSSDTSESPTEPELTAEQTAACAALVDYQALIGSIGPGKPSPQQVKQIQDYMADIAAGTTGRSATVAQSVVDTIQESLDTKNPKLLNSDQFFMSLLQPAAAGRDACGFEPVDVEVKEMPGATPADNPMFHYVGVPEELTAGIYSLGIANKGKNFHEAIVVKLKDGVTGSVEDLLAAGDKKFFGNVESTTVTFMPPGAEGFLNADLSAPGRYVVFCHIPLEGKDHRPVMGEHGPIFHFMIGMHSEIAVS